MSKSVHPIRKMGAELSKHAEGRLKDGDYSREGKDRIIARHVKPLLNALEIAHEDCNFDFDRLCDGCRLLVLWRAKP
jgi:hypothetical protein